MTARVSQKYEKHNAHLSEENSGEWAVLYNGGFYMPLATFYFKVATLFGKLATFSIEVAIFKMKLPLFYGKFPHFPHYFPRFPHFIRGCLLAKLFQKLLFFEVWLLNLAQRMLHLSPRSLNIVRRIRPNSIIQIMII